MEEQEQAVTAMSPSQEAYLLLAMLETTNFNKDQLDKKCRLYNGCLVQAIR